MHSPNFIRNLTVYRTTLTLANQEYSQVLSDRSTHITISSDDLSSQILFSMSSGASGTGKRIFQGSEWQSPGFIVGAKTIYAQSPNAGAVLIIEEWDH